MKKSFLCILAAAAMMSCTNYGKQTVELTCQADSVNYALGLVTGYGIKMESAITDSTSAPIATFIKAFDKAIAGEEAVKSDAEDYGYKIGISFKSFEKEGLANNAAWLINEPILLQGLVNGISGDTTMMQSEEAYRFISNAYQASATEEPAEGKAVLAKKCPKEAATIELASINDSLNYAFGVFQGNRISMAIAMDTTGNGEEDFVKGINQALKVKTAYPMMVMAGEQIGKNLSEWEETGLFGEEFFAVDFELIRAGIINGMNGIADWDFNEANAYISATMMAAQFGDNQANGEQFLSENALKEGVKVTESGLQYEVIKMGKGKKPAATDVVRVHYTGTLIDGTVFDSSVERGEPAEFGLNQVIAGWTEGLQLMPVGSKFRFYIPANLGYGDRQVPGIPPYSTLIFDVELLSIVK